MAEPEPFNMAAFLKDYGGHLLALIALLQVWAIALTKRFFRKGKLEVHPTASIEIGFSVFGPTISLLGTIRACERDIFIRRMRLRVVRLRDRAEHTFGWQAFRSNSISLNRTQPAALEVASSFLVTTETPRQYNVFFGSEAFAGEYQTHVQPLRDAWLNYVEREIRKVDEGLTGQMTRVLENPALSTELFNQFSNEGHATALHAALSNGFFWHHGDYELQFFVETSGRATPVTLRWKFSISERDERDLRLNAVAIVRELCYLPVTYNFAQKNYVADLNSA